MIIMSSFILQKFNLFNLYTQEMALRHQHAEEHAEQQNELVIIIIPCIINNYMIMITLLKCK
jgi:hypothetical protein